MFEVNDTDNDHLLDRLATKLGVGVDSLEFQHVWADMKAQGVTIKDLNRKFYFTQAVTSGKEHLRVLKMYSSAPNGKTALRTTRLAKASGRGWREYATALEQQMVETARREPELVEFRREALSNRLIAPTRNAIVEWVLKHGLDDHLKHLIESFVTAYWWDFMDTVRFILSDVPPPRPPIRLETKFIVGGANASPRIFLEVETWVPPSQVARAYKDARDRFRQRSGRPPSQGGYQPQRVRSIGPRAAALVSFVESSPDLSWAKRMDTWNRQHTSDRFEDRSNMRRAYLNAAHRLGPTFQFIGA